MSTIDGTAKVALVEGGGRGMKIETYKSRIAMVKAVMDNGAIGSGGSYGDAAHVAAIDEIERHIAVVRENIRRERP